MRQKCNSQEVTPTLSDTETEIDSTSPTKVALIDGDATVGATVSGPGATAADAIRDHKCYTGYKMRLLH